VVGPTSAFSPSPSPVLEKKIEKKEIGSCLGTTNEEKIN